MHRKLQKPGFLFHHTSLMLKSALIVLMVLIGSGLMNVPHVFAQEARIPLMQIFSALESEGKARCNQIRQSVADAEKRGNKPVANGIRNGYYMVCECSPAQFRQAKEKLSVFERSSKITLAQFQERYVKQGLEACAGSTLRRTYSLPTCAEDFSAKSNPAGYCSCMDTEMTKFSDAESAELGRENADYVPLLADAKKLGKEPPPAPPLVQKVIDMDTACSK